MPPPTVALKLKLVGFNAIVAWPSKLRFTCTVCGLFVAWGSATVMTPVKLATGKAVLVTETVKLVEAPGARLPEVGLTASQPEGELEAEAVKRRVAVPVLLRVTVWLGGLAPWTKALKLKLVGLSAIVACGCTASARLTLTLCGLFVACESETERLPEKLPAARPAMLTEMVSVVEPPAGTLPLVGLTLNQPELEAAAWKLSAAVPGLLSVMV